MRRRRVSVSGNCWQRFHLSLGSELCIHTYYILFGVYVCMYVCMNLCEHLFEGECCIISTVLVSRYNQPAAVSDICELGAVDFSVLVYQRSHQVRYL
jgi:hypothetical protein